MECILNKVHIAKVPVIWCYFHSFVRYYRLLYVWCSWYNIIACIPLTGHSHRQTRIIILGRFDLQIADQIVQRHQWVFAFEVRTVRTGGRRTANVFVRFLAWCLCAIRCYWLVEIIARWLGMLEAICNDHKFWLEIPTRKRENEDSWLTININRCYRCVQIVF